MCSEEWSASLRIKLLASDHACRQIIFLFRIGGTIEHAGGLQIYINVFSHELGLHVNVFSRVV